VSGDIVRPPHGSASCACLFCWRDITTLTANVDAERVEVGWLRAERNSLLSAGLQLRADFAAERAEVERLMDGMELAWGLIANGQYWDRTDGRKYDEWNEARAKWRDEHWHPALDRNKEARRER